MFGWLLSMFDAQICMLRISGNSAMESPAIAGTRLGARTVHLLSLAFRGADRRERRSSTGRRIAHPTT